MFLSLGKFDICLLLTLSSQLQPAMQSGLKMSKMTNGMGKSFQPRMHYWLQSSAAGLVQSGNVESAYWSLDCSVPHGGAVALPALGCGVPTSHKSFHVGAWKGREVPRTEPYCQRKLLYSCCLILWLKWSWQNSTHLPSAEGNTCVVCHGAILTERSC